MADITPFIAQQQLQRQQAPRAAGRGAGLPQIRAGGAGRGAAQLGRAIDQLGQVVSQVDTQFARAKAGVLSVEALSSILDEMQQTEFEIVQDVSIFPSDRADAFRQRIEPRISEMQNQLPVLGQAQFVRGAMSAFLRTERNLRDQGRQETIARGKSTLGVALQRLQQEINTVDNDFDRQQLMQSQRDIVADFVGQGILTEAEGVNTLQSLRTDSQDSRFNAAVAVNPELMRRHLELFLQDGEGLADLPIPSTVDKAVEGMARAEQLIRQRLNDEDAAERRADAVIARDQNRRASELRAELATLDPAPENIGAIRSIISRANSLRANEDLLEEDHANILGTARSILNQALNPETQTSDPLVLERLIIDVEMAETGDDLDELQQAVISQTSNLRPQDTSSLLRRIETRRDPLHYTNAEEYKLGRALISQESIPPGVVFLNTAMDQKLVAALREFDARMAAAFAEPGGIRNVRARAREEALAIRDLYFPNKGTIAGLPPLTPELKEAETLDQAREALRTMRRNPAISPESHLRNQKLLFDHWKLRQKSKQQRESSP